MPSNANRCVSCHCLVMGVGDRGVQRGDHQNRTCTFALTGALCCNRTRVVAKRCIFGQPKRQDHDDTAVDPGIARQPDTAVTRRIYFKDFLAPGCREPFSLRQGRLDDLTTSRLGDGAHPNPKSPAKGSAKHPRDFCGTLPSPSVLSCARRSQRPSSPQVLDQFVANAIRQLQNRLSTETRNCPAGSPAAVQLSSIERPGRPDPATAARVERPLGCRECRQPCLSARSP